jgi:hypothetical protein
VKAYKTPTGEVIRPVRTNYAALLGRDPHPNNAAGAQGSEWRRLTLELLRVACTAVRPGGVLLMEIKDSLEADGRHFTTHWLLRQLTSGDLPVAVAHVTDVDVHGMQNGENRDVRVPHTQLVVAFRTGGGW